jgi:hypothetical protein
VCYHVSHFIKHFAPAKRGIHSADRKTVAEVVSHVIHGPIIADPQFAKHNIFYTQRSAAVPGHRSRSSKSIGNELNQRILD